MTKRKPFNINSTSAVGEVGEGWALINLKNSTFVGEQTHDVEWPEITWVPVTKVWKVESKCSSFINNRWEFHYSKKQREGSDFIYMTLLGNDRKPLYHFLYPTKKLKKWKDNQTEGRITISIGTVPNYLPYLYPKNT